MNQAHFMEQLNSLLDNEEPLDLSPVIDYLIMVMGDNLQDMVAWLHVTRPEFDHQSALDLIQKQDFIPVTNALRKIMEQDSRIS